MSTETASSEPADESAGIYRRWVQRSIKSPENVYRAMFYVAAFFFLVTTLFPFYWLVALALTPRRNLAGIGVLPNGFNPSVFVEVFQIVPFHRYMFNSIVIALLTTVIVLVIASLTGYAFGRIDFRGRTPLMMLLLIVSYFPSAAFLLPIFRLFTGNVEILGLSSPNLFNTPGAMVLPFSAMYLPLAIFLLTTFYSEIPDGLEDAARVEGTTRIGALFRVILPLSAPGVATAGILTFISVYNEFFFSYMMTDGEPDSWSPIVWGILGYQTSHAQLYNFMAAASIVGVLPVAILVVMAQEKIVSGLTSGALKE